MNFKSLKNLRSLADEYAKAPEALEELANAMPPEFEQLGKTLNEIAMFLRIRTAIFDLTIKEISRDTIIKDAQ